MGSDDCTERTEVAPVCSVCGEPFDVAAQSLAFGSSGFFVARVVLEFGKDDTMDVELPGAYCSSACAQFVEAHALKAAGDELTRLREATGNKVTASEFGGLRTAAMAGAFRFLGECALRRDPER